MDEGHIIQCRKNPVHDTGQRFDLCMIAVITAFASVVFLLAFCVAIPLWGLVILVDFVIQNITVKEIHHVG